MLRILVYFIIILLSMLFPAKIQPSKVLAAEVQVDLAGGSSEDFSDKIIIENLSELGSISVPKKCITLTLNNGKTSFDTYSYAPFKGLWDKEGKVCYFNSDGKQTILLPNEDISLVAQWGGASFTIPTYYEDDAALTRWSSEPAGNCEYVSGQFMVTEKDLEIYNVSENKSTVNIWFENLGGNGVTLTTAVPGENLGNILIPTKTKQVTLYSGFDGEEQTIENSQVFNGYTSKSDGQGIKYYSSNGDGLRECNFTMDTVLVADWKEQKVILPKLTREGYTQKGWSLVSDSREADYPCGLVALDFSVSNLYAVWEAESVNLLLQDDEDIIRKIKINYKEELPNIEPPSLLGYTFCGYYSEESGKGTQYFNSEGVGLCVYDSLESITLYAKWKKENCTDAGSYTIGLNETLSFSKNSNVKEYRSENGKLKCISVSGGDISIKGVLTGTDVLYVKHKNGSLYRYSITIKKAPTSVKFTKTKVTLKKSAKYASKIQLSTGSASYNVTYSTSNKKIAKVTSSGKIYAKKKKGSCTITVKTYNGKSSTIKVKVK